MHWRLVALFAFVVMLIGEPAHAQTASRFSVDLGIGSHFKDGGDVESISVGFAVSRIVELAATVERSHIPTHLRTNPDGFSVTRNGTLTSMSGELRLTIPAGDRWTPYGIVGTGVGESVLNVNEFFPSPITRTAYLVFAGGGVRYSLGPAVALFGDAKLILVSGREADDLSARLPVRAGVSFRF
jgi:Outer membrane protein beta-barrel domain